MSIIDPKYIRKRPVTLDVISVDFNSNEDVLGEIFSAVDASKQDDAFNQKLAKRRYRNNRPAGTPANAGSRPIIKVTRTDATTRLMQERAIAQQHHTKDES